MSRLRSLLSLKSSSIFNFSSPNASKATHFAPFHSTSFLSEKYRKNFGSDRATDTGRSSKNSSVRFTCTVKEKGRTGAKKTLHKLLFHRGMNDPLENEWHFGPNPLPGDRHVKKKSLPGRGKKPRDKKTKRWYREGNLDDDFDTEPHNTFVKNWRERWAAHSQKASYSRNSTSESEWREGWCWTTQSQRSKKWNDESFDEPLNVMSQSQSERILLGLPLHGHIKIDDVKNAFRSAALKWHPDKHQGASQVAAQEKFKLCVDAYQSLCSTLS